MTDESIDRVGRRWLAIFEDRYGAGAYERLIAELRQPCITFADIAKRLGVTRERVRQWQMLLLPDAPRGHERQRLCASQRRKRRLLADPLFQGFYRHARAYVEPHRIELIKTSDGFRMRSVRIDRRVVVLRDARDSAEGPATPNAREYVLPGYRGAAEFLYYRLAPNDYLLLPTRELPVTGTTFTDRPDSRYQRYKNTFDALRVTVQQHTA
jgi:hypothetical protein